MFDLSMCTVMHVWSLTPEGCFHFHLLKVESLSVITLNLSLTSVCTSKTGAICEVVADSEPILAQYATYTSMIQTLRMDFSVDM